MTPHEKPLFAELLVRTSEQYNRVFNPSFLEVYWHCLEGFSLKEIQAAFLAHFKNPDNGCFMPQPSDILRLLEGDNDSQALQAWSKVMDGIKAVGAYSSIVFDDPLIHAVIVAMGGWIELCRKTQDELKFAGHEFQKRYRGYCLRRPAQYLNHLIGIVEHKQCYADDGQSQAEPVLFGNGELALLTYMEGCDASGLSTRCITPLKQQVELSASLTLSPIKKLQTPQGKNHDKSSD